MRLTCENMTEPMMLFKSPLMGIQVFTNPTMKLIV